MKKAIFAILCLLCAVNVFSQSRSIRNIFPALNQNETNAIFTEAGFVRTGRSPDGFLLYGSSSGIASSIISNVTSRNPGYLVESILVIPTRANSIYLLDIYNALGNIRDLRGRLYPSATRGQDVPLFEDATRITSDRNTSAIPDPPPSAFIPSSETVFIRLRDTNFGNTYYRGDVSLLQNGLSYSLTNFRNMTYLLLPVIRENRFTAQMYFEIIEEGVLIYSIAGVDISDFYANMLDVNSAIAKRLAVITSWAAEGILARQR